MKLERVPLAIIAILSFGIMFVLFNSASSSFALLNDTDAATVTAMIIGFPLVAVVSMVRPGLTWSAGGVVIVVMMMLNSARLSSLVDGLVSVTIGYPVAQNILQIAIPLVIIAAVIGAARKRL